MNPPWGRAGIRMANLARARHSSRLRDIAESQALLLELSTSEPMVIQCFKIIESTCLSQGICCLVDGKECTARFQHHVDTHFTAFLKESLRAMIIFRFVPWRLRRLASGDMIP